MLLTAAYLLLEAAVSGVFDDIGGQLDGEIGDVEGWAIIMQGVGGFFGAFAVVMLAVLVVISFFCLIVTWFMFWMGYRAKRPLRKRRRWGIADQIGKVIIGTVWLWIKGQNGLELFAVEVEGSQAGRRPYWYGAQLGIGIVLLWLGNLSFDNNMEVQRGGEKNMSKILIIGCGGVASVAIQKCAAKADVFSEICIASRTVSKCDALKEKLEGKTAAKITTATVNADDVEDLIALIKREQPKAVLNLALPYQDLTIMDACLACGVDYIDTANYEAEDTEDSKWRAIYEKRCKEKGFTAYFDYSWQWAYRERFEKAGITALLGSGFDPGVTSVFSAYALKHYFDEIHYIDIMDCNGGDHGYPFATNFNPEINLREVSANGSYWEDGHWVETEPMEIKREYDFAQVGKKDMYLLHHEEIESLAQNIPGIRRIRFFMTFGQSYLTHMKCLENVGMLRTDPVMFDGKEIVPIQFLKALLPDPASLGPRTVGKTNIGCIFTGVKDGVEKSIYIYNVCDHQECYKELGSQAISYTTGVPAMIGAMLVMNGTWKKPGVFNVEEFDPDPFMEALNEYGLPWVVEENPVMVD